MEIKNAIAVCLISLCSATLVVLIARALDSQAASRVEPQLASIVEELRALRKQGVSSSTGTDATAAPTDVVENGLVVYYFHGNKRCPTCLSIETQSHAVVQSDFAAELGRGEVVWKILNYDQPAGVSLAKKFEVQMAVVVLARMKDGKIDKWRRLDAVWGLESDKPAFATLVRNEIRALLAPQETARAASAKTASPASLIAPAVVAPAVVPTPAVVPPPESADLPLPAAPADPPLPN